MNRAERSRSAKGNTKQMQSQDYDVSDSSAAPAPPSSIRFTKVNGQAAPSTPNPPVNAPPVPPTPPPTSPKQLVLETQHYVRFMKQAYGLDGMALLGSPKSHSQVKQAMDAAIRTMDECKTSSRMTPKKLKRRIHYLKYWEQGDGVLTKEQFGKEYHDCKDLRYRGYYVKEMGGQDTLWRKWKKKGSDVELDQRYVDILQTYAIIHTHHYQINCQAADTTHLSVVENGFGNISNRECRAFVLTCSHCAKA